MIDYYELLQISPNADNETIHRVYKYLAARLHPDNGATGDASKFQLVKSAYEVLSNSVRRREYDAKRKEKSFRPLSTSIDFMDQLEGEVNRRIAVLAVLYYRRRMSPNSPEVSLAEMEERMGFPRDYMDFTLWYLVKKKYIDRADNACYSLSSEGVDFVEKERVVLPVLNGLLTSNTGTAEGAVKEIKEDEARHSEADTMDRITADASSGGSRVGRRVGLDDRRSVGDRRVGMPDLRIIKVERRQNPPDRRVNVKDRRAGE
jgi:curved DNA-binding protein CbpA